MKNTDSFYALKEEPLKSCLLALKAIVLNHDRDVTEAWKYGMPFFLYKGKMFCYLWVHKKYMQPYLGIVEGSRINHPDLIQESRSRMKIILFDLNHDLPVETINSILQQAIDLYKNGTIKL